MSLFKIKTLSHHTHTLLKPQNPPCNSLFSRLIFQSNLTFSPLIEYGNSPEIPEDIKSKTLDVVFKEAVGLSQAEGINESESGNGDNELKRKLRELEAKLRKLRLNSKGEENAIVNECKSEKSRSLHSLFTTKKGSFEKREARKRAEPLPCKALSPDMEVFVSHLYKEGYFNSANFLPDNKLNLSCFENPYGRDFIKFAADRFGKDNQEIAKWLSGSDLKKIVLFGCPSTGKRNVFAAKTLRKFFEIQEDTVCRQCVLKHSCQFVNQSVWNSDTRNLNLAIVMKVLILYALEAVPPQLIVPEEIKDSVSRLLKEILKLSQTVR